MHEADVPHDKANFFDAGSPFLTHPLLTPERTERELTAIEAMIGPITGPVLDVGCGFGRHSIALASRGLSVVAADPALTMITATQERADAVGVSVDAHCLAGAELDFDGQFDLVLCLFTTLGQLQRPTGADAPHLATLSAMLRALRPGGHVVVEVPDRDQLVTQLVTAEQLGPTQVTRTFNAETSTVTEAFDLEDGPTFTLTYRVFSSQELVGLMEQVGFVIDAVQDQGLVQPPNTMMTLVAHRPS